ncbi:Kinase, NEK [Giardia lamblia P15]|uniref:Kinase, NEK n=1 Tax=Giardia intestinalis (strain P15) TaxID=658858 RepID=E1EVR1_GIAIA|nr:Kinase, NEK [Giardia lamblia P15]
MAKFEEHYVSTGPILAKTALGHVEVVRSLDPACNDGSQGQEYAVKVVNITSIPNRYRSVIRNDFIKLCSLSHKNLVKYYGVYYNDTKNLGHFVMEYYERCCLMDVILFYRMKERVIPEETVWYILSHLIEALLYYHSPQKENTDMGSLVHRNIKPSKVFLAADGYCKLADSGTFRLLDNVILSSTIFGTLGFCPPEVLKMERYTEESDLWSLGALVYCVCALKPPAYSANPEELLKKLESFEIDVKELREREYSEELIGTLQSMLNYDPKQRIELSKLNAMPQIIDKKGPIKSSTWGLNFSSK